MADEVTDDELAAIEAEVAELPGKTWGLARPWYAPTLVADLIVERYGDEDHEFWEEHGDRLATFPVGHVIEAPVMWRFIAASRARVPRLVAEVRRLQAALAEAEAKR